MMTGRPAPAPIAREKLAAAPGLGAEHALPGRDQSGSRPPEVQSPVIWPSLTAATRYFQICESATLRAKPMPELAPEGRSDEAAEAFQGRGMDELMPIDDPLRRAFAPLIGLPVWSVRNGYGSFITMELGNPRLEIREPGVASPKASKRVRRQWARRDVTVRGDWHLWIYCCHWKIVVEGRTHAWSESKTKKMAKALAVIDGQLLTAVDARP